MPVEVTMKIDSKEVTDYIRTIERRQHSLKPLLVVVATIIERSVRANFKIGGRPQRWQPLSPWTMRVRQASRTIAGHGLGQPILQQSGRLFSSVTRKGAKGHIREFGPTHLRFGTELPYAALQQFGGIVKPRTAKWLALPFPGVHGRPRDYKGAFFRKSKKGNLIMFGQSTRRGRTSPQFRPKGANATKRTTGVFPLFLLKKSVHVPARPFALYQQRDIDEITNYAAAFAYDPVGYQALAARMSAAGGGI